MPLCPKSSRRASAIALLGVLALGLLFRAAHIDRKLYWHDEVYTAIRVIGYIGSEVTDALFTGTLLERDDPLQYQRLSPERGWGDTLYALTTHPEHPPLYYLLLRAWVSWFGPSVAALRSLSVVFSLPCFPALYWFYRRLFGPSVGAIACSFYTSLLSGLVWFCHGLYLVILGRWQVLGSWSLASGAAAALFSPWLWVMARNWGKLVGLLLTVPIGVLALPDLLQGGMRFGLPRYILPSLSMGPVAVAHLVAVYWRRVAPGLQSPELAAQLTSAGVRVEPVQLELGQPYGLPLLRVTC